MAELYEYQPLKEDRSIRLFRLYPSIWGSGICGELIETDLDNAPTYEALSYVWGAPEPPEYIRCRNKSIFVTANCEAALLRLGINSGVDLCGLIQYALTNHQIRIKATR
jgi:hypothetical protein